MRCCGRVSSALFEAGLYCRTDDRGDSVIQLAPPLISGQAEFDTIESILRAVLSTSNARVQLLTHRPSGYVGSCLSRRVQAEACLTASAATSTSRECAAFGSLTIRDSALHSQASADCSSGPVWCRDAG